MYYNLYFELHECNCKKNSLKIVKILLKMYLFNHERKPLNFKVNIFKKYPLARLQDQLEICKAYQDNEKISKKKSWLNKNYRALWRELNFSFLLFHFFVANFKHRLRA